MKRGRPSKFNPESAERIIAAVKGGAWRKTAAIWSGVGERTLADWLALGKAKPKSKWGVFRRAVMEAEAAAEIGLGAVAFREAQRDGEYALRFLSIRWRKRWNQRIAEKEVERAREQKEELKRMSDEELLAKVQDELRKRAEAMGGGVAQ